MEAVLSDNDLTLQDIAKRFARRIADPKLKATFLRCFMNTLDTTVERDGEGSYVITGDIKAMWLRDSTAQVMQYCLFAKESSQARTLIKEVSARQMRYILLDPYANAFNRTASGEGWTTDETQMHPSVFERKFELDSLCYPVLLAVRYYRATGDGSIFGGLFRQALETVVATFETETRHENSPYSHYRPTEAPEFSVPGRGKGGPAAYTGMVWSGYRPSDDPQRYAYNIPENLFVSLILGLLPEIRKAAGLDEGLIWRAARLKSGVDEGIRRYGTVAHEKYGTIYCYETDGLGNILLMDDANVPSLLSLPYLGCCKADDPVYLNTRRFVLSPDNPYYYTGKALSGVGSPHTPERYVWPIAVVMEGLTACDKETVNRAVQAVLRADGGTGYMHEGVFCEDDNRFTRPWFAWANSLFAYFIIDKADFIDGVER